MSENDDFDLYGDLEGFVDVSDPHKLPKSSESQHDHSEVDGAAYPQDFEDAQEEQYVDLDEGGDNVNEKVNYESDTDDLQVQLDEEDEDDVVFLVDDDDSDYNAEADAPAPQPTKKTRTWSSRFVPKERTCYVGAPLIPPGEPHKDCMCIVGGIPWYMSQDGLCKYLPKTCQPRCVCFCCNPLNGVSLGVAVLEFESASACNEAVAAPKFEFSIKKLDVDLFKILKDGKHRTGVLPWNVQGEICAKFGIAANVGLSGSSALVVAAKELEFEQQQLQMIESGDYKHATETFPWFNIKLVPLLGQYRRLRVSQCILGLQASKPQSRGKDLVVFDDEDLSSHLEAYKRAEEYRKNVNVSAPSIKVEKPKPATTQVQQQEQEPSAPKEQPQQQQQTAPRNSKSPPKRHKHKRSSTSPRSSKDKIHRSHRLESDSAKRHRHHKSSSSRSHDHKKRR